MHFDNALNILTPHYFWGFKKCCIYSESRQTPSSSLYVAKREKRGLRIMREFMWAVKAQISLHICTVWSEPTLSTDRIIWYCRIYKWKEMPAWGFAHTQDEYESAVCACLLKLSPRGLSVNISILSLQLPIWILVFYKQIWETNKKLKGYEYAFFSYCFSGLLFVEQLINIIYEVSLGNKEFIKEQKSESWFYWDSSYDESQ